MTYQLLIGQRGHSSWSLRGWLPFAVFDIDVAVNATRIYSDEFAAEVAAFGGAGTVPVVRTPEGGLLTDSIAIAWHLAEAFPDRGLLPTDPQDRAEAISLIAEMHSGFTALRGACPMNLYTGWAGQRRRPRCGPISTGSTRSGPARSTARAGRSFTGTTRSRMPSTPRWRPGSRPMACRCRTRR
jgi:glutathione S-transferase